MPSASGASWCPPDPTTLVAINRPRPFPDRPPHPQPSAPTDIPHLPPSHPRPIRPHNPHPPTAPPLNYRACQAKELEGKSKEEKDKQEEVEKAKKEKKSGEQKKPKSKDEEDDDTDLSSDDSWDADEELRKMFPKRGKKRRPAQDEDDDEVHVDENFNRERYRGSPSGVVGGRRRERGSRESVPPAPKCARSMLGLPSASAAPARGPRIRHARKNVAGGTSCRLGALFGTRSEQQQPTPGRPSIFVLGRGPHTDSRGIRVRSPPDSGQSMSPRIGRFRADVWGNACRRRHRSPAKLGRNQCWPKCLPPTWAIWGGGPRFFGEWWCSRKRGAPKPEPGALVSVRLSEHRATPDSSPPGDDTGDTERARMAFAYVEPILGTESDGKRCSV